MSVTDMIPFHQGFGYLCHSVNKCSPRETSTLKKKKTGISFCWRGANSFSALGGEKSVDIRKCHGTGELHSL